MTKSELFKQFDGIPNLAKQLGISRHAIYQWKDVPAEQAIKIEQITNGEIKVRDLRPDLFVKKTENPNRAA